MEEYLKEYRKIPKELKLLTPGVKLEELMKAFKNSVPLMVELKNEALRERHWNQLMEKTGESFHLSSFPTEPIPRKSF